ncbi:LOW QUALITY PROTEIN: hypothetical protein IFM46972_07666 [Aspergillus udagawae]|uniref:Uncharacterized protein n=1 Tax=Aspergillus udagawae TaxID=91492 RepID=A0A8H3S0M7_9EURO|nr:LOW QUALITY PROTEIN: hypothetical protein IFM46972_07666 [Aspergillus udagawae]
MAGKVHVSVQWLGFKGGHRHIVVVDVCVYHPSPVTRSWYPEPVSSPTKPANSDINSDKKAQSVTPLGTLGLTSYSGVSSENEEDVNGILAPLRTLEHRRASLSQKQVQLGARLLLTLFENLSLYETITENRLDNSPEARPHDLYSLERCPQNPGIVQDAKERYYENLLGWSQKLFDERSQLIEVGPSTTPEEYLRRVSNRWEGIGLVFSIVGQGAILERDWKSVSQLADAASADQRSLGVLAATARDACLQFCDDSGVVHDPLGWLLYQHIRLLTLVMVTMSRRNTRMPFFLAELRKRLMAGAYIMDKQPATSLGRPQISWRYCDVQLPLDLRYDEILADAPTRDAAIKNWAQMVVTAKESSDMPSGCELLFCSIREQILELSLSRCVDDLPRKAKQVSDNSRRTWEDLPSFLRWRPGSANLDDSGGLLIPLYLDFLYNDFLLYRLLVSHSQNELDALINVSHNILGTVLQLIGREIASGTGTYNIGWNASSFGIPTAGVLAIELLCQTAGSSRPPPSTFRRPETIQNLSVFASYLQYVVHPHEGNYDICQRARRILCRIPNLALSAKPPLLPSSLPADAVGANWLMGS